MYDEEDEYMTDEDRERILDIMFPDRNDPDFDDGDDGVGSMMG